MDATLTQLKRTGFKIVVAHGHGPSTMLFARNSKRWKNELGLDCFTCWKRGGPLALGLQTDHVAANETALMMSLRPELVNIENIPKDLSEKPLGLLGKDPRKHVSFDKGRNII